MFDIVKKGYAVPERKLGGLDRAVRGHASDRRRGVSR
jgi:hypothetical protein